jgi:hypothetical protein
MADINIDNVTNSTSVTNAVSDGTGTFDKLMNSVNLYLNDQYNSGRLKGTDYANVLLGSIQAVLQQAVQFELQEKAVEAQIVQTETQTLLAQEQEKLAYTERVLKDKQTAQLGLDEVVRIANVTPEAVYTPKYEEQ